MAGLNPPRINTQDAQESSDASDDHYSSASEGAHSPIPTTRVERVDDTAAHGEVPNTPAYNLRLQDAVPDEIEVVPEGQRSRSNTSRSRSRDIASDSGTRTPGGTPIPKTVVEKVDFIPSHGEVEGTAAKEMRMADAVPDEIRRAPQESSQSFEGRDEATDEVENEEGRQQWFRNMWEDDTPQTPDKQQPPEEEDRPDEDGEDGFGDDFDEFAEGEEHDDFGDFDQAEDETSQIPTSTLSTAHDTLSGLPPLNLSTCTTSAEIEEAITPYINAILPNSTPVISKSDATPIDASHFPAFQSERSLSLWQQLVSPPPMQPPDWTRSRIRRLFLVSLGVPVDLDEILPPSKQKRLILPSIGLDGDARPGSAIDRLRERGGGNESSTSLDSKTGAPKKSRRAAAPTSQKGPLPPPDFDLNAATLLCSTTVEALSVYSDPELKDHVFTLEILNKKASTVLEYWLQRVDESLKEKEALEGVIENLVGFVKGRRGK